MLRAPKARDTGPFSPASAHSGAGALVIRVREGEAALNSSDLHSPFTFSAPEDTPKVPLERLDHNSDNLKLSQVSGLLNAISYADSIKHPMNAGLDVNWHWLGTTDRIGQQAAQALLIKDLREWLQRNLGGKQAAFIWASELDKRKKLHTHFRLHCPASKVPALRAYLAQKHEARDMGDRHHGTAFAIKSKAGLNSRAKRAGYLAYILKAIDRTPTVEWQGEVHSVADLLGIRSRGSQGHILTKRAGMSQSLAPAARKASGWAELVHLKDLRNVLWDEVRSATPTPKAYDETANPDF